MPPADDHALYYQVPLPCEPAEAELEHAGLVDERGLGVSGGDRKRL